VDTKLGNWLPIQGSRFTGPARAVSGTAPLSAAATADANRGPNAPF
jgi:hypothetical protein